ncbi:hypothetical protein FDP41_001970 [Naegleria fowleri]|uniref:Uncharacterized protein n=1 Tax=Naegleria fowleri TaxID=5763 RepID=A0A6A5BZA3_NAEFO|nr:uncharacterized protein FDP41_001970 [Naegleria fowleri]KAF0978900.1 hypothetical protein FDP41_001970 [Naegleria fowleri]
MMQVSLERPCNNANATTTTHHHCALINSPSLNQSPQRLETSPPPSPQALEMIQSSSLTSGWSGFYEVLLHCLRSLRRMMFILISNSGSHETENPSTTTTSTLCHVNPFSLVVSSPSQSSSSPHEKSILMKDRPLPSSTCCSDHTIAFKIPSRATKQEEESPIHMQVESLSCCAQHSNSQNEWTRSSESCDLHTPRTTSPKMLETQSLPSSNASLGSTSSSPISSSFSSCEDLHTFLEYGRRQSLFEPGEYVSVMTEILDTENSKKQKQHSNGLQLQ